KAPDAPRGIGEKCAEFSALGAFAADRAIAPKIHRRLERLRDSRAKMREASGPQTHDGGLVPRLGLGGEFTCRRNEHIIDFIDLRSGKSKGNRLVRDIAIYR